MAAITIDISKLTLGDLEIIDKASRNELPISALIDLLDRVVEGGARHLPVAAMNEITQAITAEVAAMANPESEAGN